MEALTDAQIQTEIMTTLRKIYGNGIPNPTKLIVSRWQKDPFSFGAYSFQPVNSTPEDFTELAQPVNGKLFFAGEHTNVQYRGTVYGAFLSGERVADEVSKS
jgi:monoamine oxidase